jgi:hypothetical protein
MNLIEITAAQAEQFQAVGIRVRFAIFPEDLKATVIVPQAATDAPRKPPTLAPRKGKFRIRYRKGTNVWLPPNYDAIVRRIDSKFVRREVAEAIGLVLREHGKPMVRHELCKKVEALCGKNSRVARSVAQQITVMLDAGHLIANRTPA